MYFFIHPTLPSSRNTSLIIGHCHATNRLSAMWSALVFKLVTLPSYHNSYHIMSCHVMDNTSCCCCCCTKGGVYLYDRSALTMLKMLTIADPRSPDPILFVKLWSLFQLFPYHTANILHTSYTSSLSPSVCSLQ
jgi:hypothetical protein